ncbi:aldo/keto reductase [Paludisphaera borealis]|uniref:General stress protein 69 n=1 Tax=Paludisphaera borealis TaxID=1387353 RepID=A0A1U7CPG8_9BACT|nr:aldo/keto reductase [Paludisphaera borealis]APW60827.1 General stress protein 69 [Paludisphaera borealis]
MDFNRRDFLQTAAVGAVVAPALGAGALADSKLPMRDFGKTGIKVSALGFGSGSRFLMYEQEDRALEALTLALDLGVTYIDTAHSYGDGKSEGWIGKLMPERRKQVTLATKIAARKADDARRQIEQCLKLLQTDHLDVLHIHALSGPEDLAAIEAKGGVLEALYEAREQKIARAIGITCHAAPEALRTALERHDFNCTQMALNAAMARMAEGKGGMKATRMPTGGFEELALPVAVRKGMGVIAMKVFGQDQITSAAPIDKLLAYSLSLPVSLASLGMPKPEFIRRNIALARAFTPMPDAERRRLTDSIATERKAALVEFFRDHRDA